MERLAILLQGEFFRNLLLALAHTLWQGAAVAAVLFAYLRRTPAAAVERRYAAGVIALAAIVLGGLLTWSILSYEPTAPSPEPADSPGAPGKVAANAGHADRAEVTPPAIHTASTREAAQVSNAWRLWLTTGWLAGVVVMLARAVAVVVGGGRLRRQCKPLEDGAILDLVEQVRRRMHICRRVRVLVGEGISVPGVIGCVWPTLLLPASMVTGIAPEDLRAILTHELSHIRRYDYLVNFCQMIVEALLFFNPAVWWISRQIRIEREACCDAASILITGERTRYAEVLVAWARRVRQDPRATPAPAIGFSADGDTGGLLDRVRRIVVVGHQPKPRVSWRAATVMLVLSLLCLVLIQQVTTLAVGLAGRILTPRERIEQIATISKEYGKENREYGPEDRIQVSGTVNTWDAAPLPDRVHLILQYGRHNTTGSMSMGVSRDGTFKASVEYGGISISASADGYASAFAGPFEAEPGGSIEGVHLVLGKGFPAQILTLDEAGWPIEGAELVGGYTYGNDGSFHHTIHLQTNAEGAATLQHATAQTMTLMIEADGYESDRFDGLVLTPDEITLLTLKKAKPTAGVVVSEATGEPIAGAGVRILASARGNHSYGESQVTSTPDTHTDADGAFELNRLRRDRQYLLHVHSPGYAHEYVFPVEAGDDALVIPLGPQKIIRGRVTGDLSLLSTDSKSGEPIIHVANRYGFPERSYYTGNDKCPVTIREGVAYFEIEDFWGQTVILSAGPERVVLDVDEDPLDNVVLDLKPSARRLVVLEFTMPEDAPPLDGGVRIDYITDRAKEQGQGMTPKWLDIENNRAECEVPVPAEFKYQTAFEQGKRPTGYWFNEIRPIRIEAGDEPFVIEVPTHPAGAIYGRVLQPDGSVAPDARASLMVVQRPEIEDGRSFFSLYDAISAERGTFNATPLPLGGQYAIAAHGANLVVTSEIFSLDETNPIVSVDLTLPRGVDVHGRLLDVDGTPVSHPVTLHLSAVRGSHSWGTSGSTVEPDEAGRFVFRDVNPGPAGSCYVKVADTPWRRPARQEIPNLQTPVVVRLTKGHSVTGTVIDDKSGWPVEGAEVYALRIATVNGQVESEVLEADGRTNERGEFRFTNMGRREYRLNVRSANLADPRRKVVATGGQSQLVTLRIELRERTQLKIREP